MKILWLTGGGGGVEREKEIDREAQRQRGGERSYAVVPASEEQKLFYYDRQNHVQTEAHEMKPALSSSDMPYSQKQRLFWY